ncbi:hypothetical protein BN59_02283 [Legionella massiliensis]|uniref:Uncharacterized protein n=1 Tax=Legionella massiliensis TaxID=1034943 RepID=A0A078KY75_9GAMM|nr:hypothetical protein [Legionella massiliensis]CDZ77987.1 hypothetical protein BN59_02283 [Legionella massiliensis]CEE13725.1 hypothetical protein BN1094_02283 [Legionella massiliensis]
MPIMLNRHVKMWIHPDGLIPAKIINRLIFQRKIRPQDYLTFFVNQSCMNLEKTKIKLLTDLGIKIKNINASLAKAPDDPFLVAFARQILAKAALSKTVCDSVFATDFLRLLKVVQQEGVYSNNDVLFLNFSDEIFLRKQYLFGCHAQGIPDTYIFAMDLDYSDIFYEELIEKIKEICGDPPFNDSEMSGLTGLAFIPDSINMTAYGHLNFPETRGNVIFEKDNAQRGGEKKLHSDDGDDPVLAAAEEALKRGYVQAKDLAFNYRVSAA